MLGIGTDIVEVARIGSTLERHGEKFAQRILHPNEYQQWQQHAQPQAFLAKRFAAKEAVGKALGTGLGEGVTAADIEVDHADNGCPVVVLHHQAKTRLLELGGKQCWLSISDEKAYAVAFAVVS